MSGNRLRHIDKPWSADRIFSMAEIRVGYVPGLRCHVWCYDDDFGVRGACVEEGEHTLTFRHYHARLGAELTTRFTAAEHHVVADLAIENAGEELVRSIGTAGLARVWSATS